MTREHEGLVAGRSVFFGNRPSAPTFSLQLPAFLIAMVNVSAQEGGCSQTEQKSEPGPQCVARAARCKIPFNVRAKQVQTFPRDEKHPNENSLPSFSFSNPSASMLVSLV